MARQHERTLSRQMAVQALYWCLVSPENEWPEPTDEISDEGEVPCVPVALSCSARLLRLLEEDPSLPDAGRLPAYARRLLAGVAEHFAEHDELLAEASENWSVERMPVVDHAILQLAVQELLHEQEVPVSVCINEAVELARSFGGEDDSARFVNGLLGRIARTRCADRIDAGAASFTPQTETSGG